MPRGYHAYCPQRKLLTSLFFLAGSLLIAAFRLRCFGQGLCFRVVAVGHFSGPFECVDVSRIPS